MKPFKPSCPLAGFGGEDIAKRITALREHLGLERKEFSELTGLKIEQVRKLETGRQQSTRGDPSVDQIARKCGVQPVWLYAGSNVPRRMWPDWWRP